jgi:uncharacterized protein (DUF2252 family)
VTTARMMEQMIDGYQDALIHKTRKQTKESKASTPIQDVLKRALRRRWKHLAEERIEDVRPQIPLGKRFWALSKEEKSELEKLFETETVRKLVTSLRGRDDAAKIKILDAAYWVKGCSSLGRLRYAVLLQVGKTKGTNGKYCLIDIKEGVQAAAPRAAGSKIYKNHAERVAEGASKLSPFLGERMLAAHLLGRSVVIRELLPQDLKLEMESLTADEAIAAARYLAFVVGRAHARQMNPATRKKWLTVLRGSRGKQLDAPSWLWKSVVELIANHEAAYLEHCRRYALQSG